VGVIPKCQKVGASDVSFGLRASPSERNPAFFSAIAARELRRSRVEREFHRGAPKGQMFQGR
jgi:hypothetical protein